MFANINEIIGKFLLRKISKNIDKLKIRLYNVIKV